VKVFLVTRTDIESWRIESMWSTRIRAELAARELAAADPVEDYDVEEWEVQS
jgi:hypothetical protein